MINYASVWPGGIMAAGLAFLVAGCASTGITVVSKTEGGSAPAGQPLIVVSQLAAVDETWAAGFEKAMDAELRKLGSPFLIQSRIPLALQADTAIAA